MNGVHLGGVLPGRRADGPARDKGERHDRDDEPGTARELAHRAGRSPASGRGARLAGEKREGTAWRPAVDISEGGDAYRVTVEIPGIKVGEVEITMTDGLLTIQGERHAA